MKKLAITSSAFLFNQDQPTNDFHALVHKLQHLGYQGIELGGVAPHPNPESHDTKEKRQKLRKMVADHRMEFSALVPDFWNDRAPFLTAFEKNVIFAEDLGIRTILVETGEPITQARDAGIEPTLVFDRCVKGFDQCAKLAAAHGLTAAWAFEPAHPPAEIVKMIDAVQALGNANFGALFDTGDAYQCTSGDPVSLLSILKDKIVCLRLADTDGTLNAHGRTTRVPLGQGVLNFDQLIPEILTCGVPNDWWCVDLCFVPDAWNVAAEAKRFLDKLRHKYAA